MGIKINKAFNSRLQKEVHISSATQEMRKNKEFVCLSPNCSAQLTYAERHKKTYRVKTKFFRLLPKNIHSDDCQYNTIGQVNIISKRSDRKILENISKGKYEFRLNLVFEEKREKVKKSVKSVHEQKEDESKTKPEKVIRNSGKKSPYLAVMRDVLILRSKVQENKSLSEVIRLKYKSKTIAWKNFFFELEEEKKCFDYIQNKGRTYKKRISIKHAVCSELILKKNCIVEKDTLSIVKTTAPYFQEPNSEGQVDLFKLKIFTKNEKVIDYIKAILKDKDSVRLLAFYQGKIEAKPYVFKDENKTQISLYSIDAWINEPEQIIEI